MARTYMARLGPFTFSLDTAAFQNLRRSTEYRWQQQNRIGRLPAQQFTGPGADTIKLDGVIYPHFAGGAQQVGMMREMAGLGEPLDLIYAFESIGQFCGLWCIKNIEEGRTVFFDDGSPRRIEFSLELVNYGEDA